MIFASQYGSGAFPVGAILQGYTLPYPQWIRCDRRSVIRADYPRLSSLFPFGVMTGVARTLAQTNARYSLTASPTYFVAGTGGSNTTQMIQYSTDGATWSQASVLTNNNQAACVLWAGSRFVLLPVNGATPGNPPQVTTGDNPNSTWVNTTGIPSPSGNWLSFNAGANYSQMLAYSPQLGRVLCGSPQDAATPLTQVYTLDNGSTVWTVRAGLTARIRNAICWSGAYFLATTPGANVVSVSADGIAWFEIVIPGALSAGKGSIASNGSGIVVVTGSPLGIFVSIDHGFTWIIVQINDVQPNDGWIVHYAGDRFCISTIGGIAMAANGKNWFIDATQSQLFLHASGFAKKGSTIVINYSSQTAYSYTESATNFYAPFIQAFTPSVSGVPTPQPPHFIKGF